MSASRKPKLAVWKFASCDGCQLSLLDCEDELLTIVGAIDLAYFPEASRAMSKGPYDLSLVEGSITTPHDAERIHSIRRSSRVLVTIGACATSGGIQALRNFANVDDYTKWVYPNPQFIQALRKSTPIAEHVRVDLELRGCPISKSQLIEVISAFLHGRKPNLPTSSVCVECKRRGTVCVAVTQAAPCLGPVTQAGCDALCPSFGRACFGCFGPSDSPNTEVLGRQWRERGMTEAEVIRAFRGFNAWADAFRRESEAHER
jgi:sulfhydrogenase subunit delta